MDRQIAACEKNLLPWGKQMKKKRFATSVILFLFVGTAFLLSTIDIVSAEPGTPPEFPVKNMVTMVDLGATACVPCKMMAPILEKLEKDYKGRAAILYIDLLQDPDQAKRFGIRTIPTQIFYDREGNEVYRHVGFMSEDAIVAQLKKMGVK